MTASMTASGERRSLTATRTPSSRSSSRSATSIGRFTTRVTVVSSVSSSAAAAGRDAAGSNSRHSASSARVVRIIMSAPCRGAERAGRRQRRRHDVLVAGAAAQVARDGLPDLRLRGVRALAEKARERHEEARRAEAALQPVMLVEGLLQGIQALAVGETLHGVDLVLVDLRGEHET